MRREFRRITLAALGLCPALAFAADAPPLPTLRVPPPAAEAPELVAIPHAAPAPRPVPVAAPMPALTVPALAPAHAAAKPVRQPRREGEDADLKLPEMPTGPTPMVPPAPAPAKPAAERVAPPPAAMPAPAVRPLPSAAPAAREVPRVDRIAPRIEISQTVPAEAKQTDVIPVELVVANRGPAAVEKLIVTVELPEGVDFVGGTPSPARNRDTLIWSLGQLPGGQERVLRYRATIKPGADLAEFAPVATARYDAALATPVRLMRPLLVVEVAAAAEAVVNGPVSFQIKIANKGNCPANNVVLRAPLPPELKHPYGPELENDLGSIEPGAQRTLTLPLTAVRAGRTVARLTVTADGAAPSVKEIPLDVRKIDFSIQAAVARTRVLNRPIEYQFTMANEGAAPTAEARVVAALPRGVSFVHASDPGVYDAALHQVSWSLGHLKPSERKLATLTGVANELGTQVCKASASANGIERVAECQTVVQGVAALQVGLLDTVDPLDVGGVTLYEIKLVNQGTAAQSNIVVRCLVPPELEAMDTRVVGADSRGPSAKDKIGAEIAFTPIAAMPPKGEAIFKIKARAKKAGDVRFRVEVSSDQHRRPIVKEEATRIFGDDGP